jgi:hypothetical protein
MRTAGQNNPKRKTAGLRNPRPASGRDRLGVSYVQISIRLGREAGVHAPLVFIGLQVIKNDFPDEIRLDGRGTHAGACPGIIFWRGHELFP